MNKVLRNCTGQFSNFLVSDTVLQSRLLVRTLIEEANVAVIQETRRNLRRYKIRTVEDVRRTAMDIVAAPAKDWTDFNHLKDYLYDNVYKKAQVCIMNEKGKLVIRRIFEHLEKAPEMLPGHWKTRYEKAESRSDKRRVLTDYISGMTDRYAMDLYQMMFAPYEKVMFEFRER